MGQGLFQENQAFVRHGGVVETQMLQRGQLRDGLDAGVGDARARQFELLERGECSELLQTFVGHSRVVQFQAEETGERL